MGLVTYKISKKNLEIITLNVTTRGKGIGTALLKAVEKTARKLKRKKVWLITTNDNIDALRFYQTRGFIIKKLYPNAIVTARKIKPEIPVIGNYGIPIRDAIELEIILK